MPRRRRVKPDRQRSPLTQRSVVGRPVQGAVADGRRLGHAAQLCRRTPDVNPRQPSCNNARRHPAGRCAPGGPARRGSGRGGARAEGRRSLLAGRGRGGRDDRGHEAPRPERRRPLLPRPRPAPRRAGRARRAEIAGAGGRARPRPRTGARAPRGGLDALTTPARHPSCVARARPCSSSVTSPMSKRPERGESGLSTFSDSLARSLQQSQMNRVKLLSRKLAAREFDCQIAEL